MKVVVATSAQLEAEDLAGARDLADLLVEQTADGGIQFTSLTEKTRPLPEGVELESELLQGILVALLGVRAG